VYVEKQIYRRGRKRNIIDKEFFRNIIIAGEKVS